MAKLTAKERLMMNPLFPQPVTAQVVMSQNIKADQGVQQPLPQALHKQKSDEPRNGLLTFSCSKCGTGTMHMVDVIHKLDGSRDRNGHAR